jgi:hypothetical protein
MEADWEFEVGGEAPVIDAHWAGFIDLQHAPQRAWELPEAERFPALAETLAWLNAADSPVWTSKCDLWPELEPEAFNAVELDAEPDTAVCATGCYMDLLARNEPLWQLPEQAAAVCRRICLRLAEISLRGCRADLVIRRAILAPERMDLGITAYLTACGATPTKAAQSLQAALNAFADALCGHSTLE